MEPTTVSEKLRQVIESDKRPASQIAKASGVDPSVLSRFRHGGMLNSDNLDKLAAHYGLRLTRARKGR